MSQQRCEKDVTVSLTCGEKQPQPDLALRLLTAFGRWYVDLSCSANP